MMCNKYEYMLDIYKHRIVKFIVAFGYVIIYLYRTE